MVQTLVPVPNPFFWKLLNPNPLRVSNKICFISALVVDDHFWDVNMKKMI